MWRSGLIVAADIYQKESIIEEERRNMKESAVALCDSQQTWRSMAAERKLRNQRHAATAEAENERHETYITKRERKKAWKYERKKERERRES